MKYTTTLNMKRKINKIVLHCEATPEGEEFSDESVNLSHKQRKFTPYIKDGKTYYIGYHYIIHLDGSVHACRPEEVIGCHASGHNKNSIGISYVGGCPPRSDKNWMKKGKDTRTPQQKASLLKLLKELKANGIDATVDNRSEKIGFKIREARLDKLPYMLVVGQQEEADHTASVRSRFAGNEGTKPVAEFIDAICKEIRTKEIRVELPEEEKNK